ncbi:MAG: TonB family protein [Bryobacteraceae bacterium]
MDWEQWVGEVIDGKYPLHRCLGSDDRSAVYLTGYSATNLQKAAIKLVTGSAKEIDSLIVRWNQTADLQHPHLVDLVEAGRSEIDGTEFAYIVTDYADESLVEVLPERPLTEQEARDMLHPALEALGFLHERRFAHTAVKPSNLLAVRDALKLARDSVRKAGDPVDDAGPYLAPEAGQTGGTPAADMWALGVTLVEVLTCKRPVNGAVPSGLPEPFGEIARNCLTTVAAARWSVPKVVAALLGEEIAVVPESKEKRSWSSARIAQIVLLMTGVILVGGVILRPVLMPDADPLGTPTTKADVKPLAVPADPPANPVPMQPAGAQPVTVPDGRVEEKQVRAKTAAEKRLEAKLARQKLAEEKLAARKLAAKERADKREADRKAQIEAAREKQQARQTAPPEVAKPQPAATVPAASGDVVRQVMPEILPSAQRTIQGKVGVVVRIQVSPSGDVSAATLDSRGPSWYFADLALDASKKWKFTPAEGASAPRTWIVQYQFQRSGTKVAVKRAGP